MQSTNPRPQTWLDMMPAWTSHMRSARRSQRTIDLRLYQVKRFFLTTGLAPADVRLQDLRAWIENPNWKANTAQVAASSMSGFFKFAKREHYLKKNPAKRLESPKVPNGIPKPATDQQILDAIANAKPRVKLMVQLGSRIGLRAMEIAAVRTDDVAITAEGPTLRVFGKGAKTRIVPISDETAELIIYQPEGYLFPGRIDGHIAPATVSRYVSKVLPEGVTCHKLRHRFATKVYENTEDILAVKELLGHASVATSQVYVQVQQNKLRAAAMTAA